MSYRRNTRAYPTVHAWMFHTGTTQQDLAKLLNISQSHLSNILNGNRKPSLPLAIEMARLTNVPIETISTIQKSA